MIDKPIGAALSRDIRGSEATEAGLDALILRRHDERVKNEGERAVEDAWRDAERKAQALRERQNAFSRLAWCKHLRGVYTARAQEYDAIVAELEGSY